MDKDLAARVESVLAESGLTRAKFAAAVGMDSSKLSKALSGRRRFSSLELALVAEVGKRTVDWLLTGKQPASLRFARRATMLSAEIESAGTDTVTALVGRFRGLEAIGRPMNVPELPHPRLRTNSYVAAARGMATLCVEALGDVRLSNLDNLDLIDAIENAFGVLVVVRDLPDGIDGLTYEEGNIRVIVLAATDQPFRQRFTLAHELAHVVFGDAEQGLIEEQLWAMRSTEESRANTFAAAFLAPAGEVVELLGQRAATEAFDELVMRFRLTPKSLAWCLFNQGLLSESDRDRYLHATARGVAMRSDKTAYYAELASSSAQERPAWSMVSEYLRAYHAGEVTLKPVATLLGWSLEYAQEFFEGFDEISDAEDGLAEA